MTSPSAVLNARESVTAGCCGRGGPFDPSHFLAAEPCVQASLLGVRAWPLDALPGAAFPQALPERDAPLDAQAQGAQQDALVLDAQQAGLVRDVLPDAQAQGALPDERARGVPRAVPVRDAHPDAPLRRVQRVSLALDAQQDAPAQLLEREPRGDAQVVAGEPEFRALWACPQR